MIKGRMEFAKDITELIGNTPLLRLNNVTEGVEATILAKLENLNPCGNLKDRIALAMIEDAEKKGKLKPGDTIIETTSGNTGLSLGMIAAIKGYKLLYTISSKVNEEKRKLLKVFGAEFVECPYDAPYGSPEERHSVAKRLEKETPNSYFINQYDNMMNPEAHYRTTGKEIWEQTDGKLDVFVSSIGTGGTITGVARYLKEKKPEVKIVGVDPEGSILTGKEFIPWKVEGIGQNFIPNTLDLSLVDETIKVNDKDSFEMTRRLAREEGLFLGGLFGHDSCRCVESCKGLG